MENVFLAVKEDGVSGVVPSLVPGNNVEVAREKIDDLAFAFVAPLGADHNQISQSISQVVVNHLGDCIFGRVPDDLLLDHAVLEEK